RDAELRLELLHGLAGGRHGHAQLLRRPAEAPLLGDGHERKHTRKQVIHGDHQPFLNGASTDRGLTPPAAISSIIPPKGTQRMITTRVDGIKVHTHVSGEQGALVSAYLVETTRGIVAIDGTLTMSESERHREGLLSLGKPLLAVLVTCPYPDHVAGITNLV